ncbi:hypothetical protein PHYSODRAFT_333256 [Phytophthora sojae]|uniref:FLYWCH-type domain-containing protein n=1 Tax=Phytophthora sojae (strain P6497) TaxID=1094619 RepID=G4ZLT0_PHYSP|nr:hypothetical protein PHYSODRAFT_333256 [Phytophthora sojae]EGZ14973.1 hypothetical protein PHYSODRAFT_333256 [Phytophthora sojae]|eukprot:XP_009528722.1 hypothetical protein PHYSODRAFT_333256 [Phytophthora sojae]
MASGYISDESMSNSLLADGSELSDTETVLLLSQSLGSEHEESDGTQLEVAPPTDGAHSTGLAVANSGSGTIHYGGYSYAQYHFNPRTDTRHYRCSAYRRTNCKAKFYVSGRGAVEDGEHEPACVPGFRRTSTGPAPAVTDRKEGMLLMTDTIWIIVMLYDLISELFLPIWYVLTDGKTAQFAMITSVQNQFPESRIVGCLFHSKQALHRKMLKLKITEDEVDLTMREGCNGYPTYGYTLRGAHEKYFKKIWIYKFKPEWWNINSVSEDIVLAFFDDFEEVDDT